jgi:tetratricopeptide (TPR) repeat protein
MADDVSNFIAARELFHRGQFAAAERASRTFLIDHPRHAGAHCDLGMALMRQKRITESINAFEAALTIAPGLLPALEALGSLYGETNRPADAVRCLDRLLAVMPVSPGAHIHHYLRGRALLRLGRKPEAAAAFEAALSLRPDYVGAWEMLGIVNGDLGRPHEALRCFERLCALRPSSAPAHDYCGMALVLMRQYEEAIERFRKAIKLDPRFLRARSNLGEPLSALGRNEEALAAYEGVLEIDPQNAMAETGRGDVLQILGRIDEAAAAYERAIALSPRKPTPYRRLLQVRTVANADDPALKVLQDMVTDAAKMTDTDGVELHLALAKAYRDLDCKDLAFKHLIEGNRLKRHTLAYDETAALADLRTTADVFTPDVMRAKAGLGDSSEQPVFVIGMPRSGTSLVEQILASHSQVFGAGELAIFGQLTAQRFGRRLENLSTGLSGENLRQLGADYAARIAAKAPDAKRIIDKMPINFRFAGLIHLALPKARIVHMMRDPMDTCFSCYCQTFLGELNFAYDLGELGRYYKAYAALMAHWRTVLPAETMLEIRYETLVENFEAEARRLIGFCGLAWEDRCLRFHETKRAVRTASAVQVRRPLYHEAIGRWKDYAQQLEPLRAALGD